MPDSSFITVLVLAIGFTVVMAIGQSVYWSMVARREREHKELSRRLGMLGEDSGQSLFRERARDLGANALGRLGLHLREQIDAADLEITVSTLLIRMVVIGTALALGAILLFGATGALVFPVGAVLPYILVRRSATQRAKAMLEQLPDSLDLMARSLQAGLGLSEAFRMCAEEMPLPIAQEFGRVFEEIRLGRDYREALGHLTDRNPTLFDLRLFVSSVLLQRETGGNLIEILDNIASTIRSRFLFDAKVRALTSEARFSALILGGLPLMVSMLLLVVNPTYLGPLFYDPLGNYMLLFCLCSYGAGMYIMRLVSQVEV